ncbi:MAG: Ig-like domain-containing protein [Candidatus Peribacteria bacterium]|nr:MAG: Ig-like domain-containing protein [Candidatus Peribacteria bacterium]
MLLEQWSNKGGLDRNNSNTNKCYRVDNTAPTMSVNLNGYTNDTWTQNNVTISVNVSDGGAGVDTVRFYVNGNLERTGTSFDYTLSEEGEYVVDTVAYDNAKYSSYDGSGLSTGNGDTVRKIIKIDTSAPVFTQDASPTTQDWSAAKPNVGFKMEDKYKGRNTVSKVFTCPVLPTNATELYPRIA